MTALEHTLAEQERRPLRQAAAGTAGFAALLGVMAVLGIRLAGNWSVETAWNRAVAAVTARPEYRVAMSLTEDGGSGTFVRELLAAEVDSAAVGEPLLFLPVRDLLETAAAFESVTVEGVTLTGGGFLAVLAGEPEQLEETAGQLEQMAAYTAVTLERDPAADRWVLTCLAE